MTEDGPPTRDVDFTWSLGRFTSAHFAGLVSVDVAGAHFPSNCASDTPDGQTFKVPSEGAQFIVRGMDELGTLATKVVRSTDGDEVDVRLSVEHSIHTVLPVDGAIDVSTRPTLRWTSLPGASVQIVSVSRGDRRATFVLPAREDRLDISNLEEMGFRLEAGEVHDWNVVAIASPAGPEDFLEGKLIADFPFLFLRDELKVYESAPASFTTAP
jgi:hypothetical protein